MLEVDKIIIGDSAIVLQSFPSECIDLTVTSPPYDNLRKYNGYTFDFDIIAQQLYRVTKSGGVVVWITNDETVKGSETLTSFKQVILFKEYGFNVETMIWEKQTFTDTGSLKVRYGNIFEYMFILSKGRQKTFNPIKDKVNTTAGRKKHGTVRQIDGSVKPISSIGKEIGEYGQRNNIWKINTEVSNAKRKHPAQFPEQLANDHIISWSNEGDIVLDCFAGSGTTLKMAKLLNRHYIGIEISDEYVNIANKRLQEE